MKSKLTVCIILHLLLCAVVKAQEKSTPVFPTAVFDKMQAGNMLNSGTSVIKGVVAKKQKNLNNTFLGIIVTLFPCTAYFNEWYDLQKKNGKTLAMMSPEAYSYRVLAKASDEDGSFEFRNLKPGKYYLQTIVQQGKMEKRSREIGTSTTVGYNVHGQQVSSFTEPIYEDFKLFYNTSDLVKKIVEITAEGQTIQVKL
ncbi:hypothetical protein [Pedobacter rhodius]|uniref:Carboxypeptidase regulatory-like domain-containing protein n=1 Tax=Pedobacter rhodius TaxID=3004098 RepID=A0ABT4KWN4_9SPHI|nr:hypothetical protein [Pedobacter sp. SJ11]MCZ4223340.1 hypothetical protein [Pedobacter sp. SJ11]